MNVFPAPQIAIAFLSKVINALNVQMMLKEIPRNLKGILAYLSRGNLDIYAPMVI